MRDDLNPIAVALIVVAFAVICTIAWFVAGWCILWCVDFLGYSDQIDEVTFKTIWLAMYASLLVRGTSASLNKND